MMSNFGWFHYCHKYQTPVQKLNFALYKFELFESSLYSMPQLSFTNGVSEANVVKWKGIKNRHKKISPARIWMGVRVSVCLSVCLCVCVSVRIKKLNNFWWNERILMKFSGPVQLLASNFWAGESDQPAQRLRPWAENGLFLENLSPPWVFVLLGCDIPFWKP